MHKLLKVLTFMGALLALTFCAVSCKTDDDDEPTMYTVTVSDSLEHGKVTADKSSAEAGAKVKLTATADSGYELDSYSVKDASANELTVTDGTFTMPKSNVTVSATFTEMRTEASGKIGKYEKPYKVGDIVFSDGSATPYSADLTLSDAQKDAAVAVIFYAGSASDTLGAKTLGVGLRNATGLAWARHAIIETFPLKTDSAEGWSTNITAIRCTPSTNGAGTATFTGDLDGSDNWKALCDAVSDEGTSGNYPAWEWVNAYATENSLEGSYASGWYLPTLAELSMLYRVKDSVNSALEKAGGTKIADEVYWSSSQVASNDYFAWYVWLGGGNLVDLNKYVQNSVCTVRAF